MAILPKEIRRFNPIPRTKYLDTFPQTRTNTSKIYIWNYKIPRIAKVILKKDNKAGWIILPDFRLHYKAIIITTAEYWHTNRYISGKE